MLGIPRFAEWLESTNLAATLTPTMEKQTRQEEQQENTVQWREEYHTHWHDHIKVSGLDCGLLLYCLPLAFLFLFHYIFSLTQSLLLL